MRSSKKAILASALILTQPIYSQTTFNYQELQETKGKVEEILSKGKEMYTWKIKKGGITFRNALKFKRVYLSKEKEWVFEEPQLYMEKEDKIIRTKAKKGRLELSKEEGLVLKLFETMMTLKKLPSRETSYIPAKICETPIK